MATSYPQLAGDRDATVSAPPQIFIGEAPIVTDSAPALAAIAQWELLKITPTGVTPLVDADLTAGLNELAGQGIAVAQLAVAIGKQCMYYTAGKFNHALIVWPASLDTYAKRKAFCGNSSIQIGHAKPPSA